MTVRGKLTVIILVVALVPLGVSAWTTLRVHQNAFESALEELHARTAQHGAGQARAYFDNAVQTLSNLIGDSIVWRELSPNERAGALWLVYGQLGDIATVSLLDESGAGIGPSVYPTEGLDTDAPSRRRPPVSAAGLEQFAKSIPFEQAATAGFAVGEPYVVDGVPTVALAFAADRSPRPWVVGVALALRSVCRILGDARPAGTHVLLLDRSGRRLCDDASAGAFAPAEHLGSGEPISVRYVRDDNEMLAALAPTANGWTVVVEQSASVALAPGRQILLQMLFWIATGLIGALVAGALLARAILVPLRKLSRGARQVALGNFTHRVKLDQRDEFGGVSEAFDTMCDEIESWNLALTERVEQRTRELKEAQAELLESRKIAAVASLGAGVAHEINNPLTAVLAISQVLADRAEKNGAPDREVRMLRAVENEAQRIRRVVERIHRLSMDYDGQGFTSVEPAEVLDRALASARAELDSANVEVIRDFDDRLPAILGSEGQLREAVDQIIQNAVQAMNGRHRRLTVSASVIEDELIKIQLADTGKGIPTEFLDKIFEPFVTTKNNNQQQGLGLSLAYRIIEAHRGKLKASSTVGVGTTMTITLPVMRRGAHLI